MLSFFPEGLVPAEEEKGLLWLQLPLVVEGSIVNSFVNQPLFPRVKQFLSCQEGLEVHLLHMNVPFNHHFCIIDTHARTRAHTRARQKPRETLPLHN